MSIYDLRLAKLKEACPMPWYLDQDNSSGVVVKDNRGGTVYAEFFEFPDEFGANQLEDAVYRSRALAHFLLSLSVTG